MDPKRIQPLFLFGVCTITLHFTLLFGKAFFHFVSLNKSAPAKIVQWEIVPFKNRFAINAKYHFETQEKFWQKEHTFHPPYYLNEWAALEELKSRAKQPWIVYYKEKNPQISALEKIFPIGLLFRMGCCLGVLIYFFNLKTKVNKKFLSSI